MTDTSREAVERVLDMRTIALLRRMSANITEEVGEILPTIQNALKRQALTVKAERLSRAADRIEEIPALLARAEAAEAERDIAAGMFMRSSDEGFRQKARAEAAEARAERLEEALREIEWSNDSQWQADRARAALTQKEPTDGE